MGDELRLLQITIELSEKLLALIADKHSDLDSYSKRWRMIAAAFWHSVRGEQRDELESIAAAVDRVYPDDDGDRP